MSETNKQISSDIVGLRFAEETSLGLLFEEDPNAEAGSPASNGSISNGTFNNNADFTINSVVWDGASQQLSLNATNVSPDNAHIDVEYNGNTVGSFVGFNEPPSNGAFSVNTPDTSIPGTVVKLLPIANPAGLIFEVVISLAGVGIVDGESVTIKISDSETYGSSSTVAVTFDSYAAQAEVFPDNPTVWYPVEPNEFEDFGGEIQTIARSPISRTRQMKKGVAVDVDSSGGWQQDLVQKGHERLYQGFFFADAIERVSTHPVSGNPQSLITIDQVLEGEINTDEDHSGQLFTGSILQLSGFAEDSNNGVFVIESYTPQTIEIANLVAEPTTIQQSIETVGYKLNGPTNITLNDGKMQLNSAGTNWPSIGFTIGEWIAIKGFANNAPGMARVIAVGNDVLTLDQPNWASPSLEASSDVEIYFGRVFRNAVDPDDVKCRSFQLERTLGEDADGTQSEYLRGQVPNTLTLSVESVDKVMTEMSFVGTDVENRTGQEGLKAGGRPSLIQQDAYNTSSNIKQMRLYTHSDTAATPESLFGFVAEAEVVINNNVEGLKAIGHFGSFDVNVGDFEVSGELEVYFASVEAMKAVRCNKDVGFNMIGINNNSGWVFDIPLLSLGGGRAEVEKGSSIMLPLEIQGGENEWGYTALSTWFCYLPDDFHIETDC